MFLFLFVDKTIIFLWEFFFFFFQFKLWFLNFWRLHFNSNLFLFFFFLIEILIPLISPMHWVTLFSTGISNRVPKSTSLIQDISFFNWDFYNSKYFSSVERNFLIYWDNKIYLNVVLKEWYEKFIPEAQRERFPMFWSRSLFNIQPSFT